VGHHHSYEFSVLLKQHNTKLIEATKSCDAHRIVLHFYLQTKGKGISSMSTMSTISLRLFVSARIKKSSNVATVKVTNAPNAMPWNAHLPVVLNRGTVYDRLISYSVSIQSQHLMYLKTEIR